MARKEPTNTEHIETEDTVTELTTSQWDGTLRSIVQWKPKSIELMYGLELPADTPEQMFVAVRHMVDQYTRARAVAIDDYLNVPITLCGLVMHMGTVRNNDKGPIPIVMNEDGEVDMPSPYSSQYRQVFKVCAVNGEDCKPFYLKFMARSVEQECVETFIPRYGPGDWSVGVNVKITQVSTNSGGRAYNFEFL